jgi:hypothetical protein
MYKRVVDIMLVKGVEMSLYVSAIPAYGRDYKTKKEVLKAWNEGQDFLIQDMFLSGYVNKEDKPKDMVLNIRYKNQTQVCVIK